MTFEETDNHDLNTYDQGDTGWEHSTDMETIEQRLVVRDLEANRTNYTAYDDATFIASDTGAVYDGDGANWNKASRGVSSLDTDHIYSASKPATITLWKSSGGTVYWDGDGGIVASSGSAGDFGTALQDAINALPSGSQADKEAHGHIHISAPPAHYVNDNGPVTLKGGLQITMDGWHHAYGGPEDHTSEQYIEVTSNATKMFVPPNVDTELIPAIRIEGLTVQGPGINVAGSNFIDNSGGSNILDLLWIRDNFIRDFELPFFLTDTDSPRILYNHIYNSNNELIKAESSEIKVVGNALFNGAQSGGTLSAVVCPGEFTHNVVNSNPNMGYGFDGSGEAKCLLNTFKGGVENNHVKDPGRFCAFNRFASTPGADHIYAGNSSGVAGAVVGPNWFDAAPTNDDIFVDKADVNIIPAPYDDVPSVNDNGTRTRWDGVIGGGPLGGVDLSTTTGQFDGDLAVANGTSAASDDAWARWDAGGGVWDYVDPTGSV